jgi:dienelactone hydrolase
MELTRREWLSAAGLIGFAGCSIPAPSLEDIASSHGHFTTSVIEPDSDAGFHYPYFLYEPEETHDQAQPLFVQTHNAPAAATREELRSQVRDRETRYLRLAHKFDIPGIIPAFPRTPNDGTNLVQNLSLPSLGRPELLRSITTSEFPKETVVRVDQQLLAMIEDARRRLRENGYDTADRIHMHGFSSSGQFASRFAFLHPNRVRAISVGGDGAHPLPKQTLNDIALPYPLGTADYQSITGRQFNFDAWNDIHKFIFVGQEDQPLPDTDPRSYYDISVRHRDRATTVFGQNRVTERLPLTHAVYTDVGANANFHVYPGVGHKYTSKMQTDVQEFHNKSMDGTTAERITVAEENVPPKPADIPAALPDSWTIEFAARPTAGDTTVLVNAAYPANNLAETSIEIRVFASNQVDMGSEIGVAPHQLRTYKRSGIDVRLDRDTDPVPLTENQPVTIALMDNPDEGALATTTRTTL